MQYEKREKTASGYRRTVTVSRSNGCSGCPFKTDCSKGNNCKTPMEDRQKVLYVSKKMKEENNFGLKMEKKCCRIYDFLIIDATAPFSDVSLITVPDIFQS